MIYHSVAPTPNQWLTQRQYDLVVWGATGVAGSLVAEYLTTQYPPEELALALGGRNRDRLETLEAELTEQTDGREEIPIVIADATEPETLRAMAEQTRVVCTTVGPYTRYGTPLVDACVTAGTDYCDLTGEVNWVREIIDRYHDEAVESDTRIIHSCGFDSIRLSEKKY